MSRPEQSEMKSNLMEGSDLDGVNDKHGKTRGG